MIKITSKSDGFYRCGIPHPATATEHADDRFSNDELNTLEKEQMLIVERIEDADPYLGSEPEPEPDADPYPAPYPGPEPDVDPAPAPDTVKPNGSGTGKAIKGKNKKKKSTNKTK